MTVEHFTVDGITQALADHGVTKGSPGPLKTWVRTRGPNAVGAKEGTPELYVGDPDGINVQLQDVSYCGGGGVVGNICKPIESAPAKGLIALRDLRHFTLGVSDRQRFTAFYQDLFGMPIQAQQGVTTLLAVGSKRQFIAIGGVNGAQARASNIAHGWFTMEVSIRTRFSRRSRITESSREVMPLGRQVRRCRT
jgi:hypothetical protein